MIPPSALDLFPVSTGMLPTAAIHASVELVRRADYLGYHRYWVAEHHNTPGIASSAPEVLIGHLAGASRHIRIGAGGMMLPNHSPLQVLEIFRTLEAIYPGRIDLGIERAPVLAERLASPRLASPRLASPRLASPRLASPRTSAWPSSGAFPRVLEVGLESRKDDLSRQHTTIVRSVCPRRNGYEGSELEWEHCASQ
jgi:hypothetical protein